MSALPPSLPPDGNEAESLAQLAVQISDLTALLKRENDGGLSPQEVALIPEANVRAESKAERPVIQLEGHMVFGALKIPVCMDVYGTIQPRFAGSRETPEERAFVEIDRVMLSSRDGECDIYDALSWADLQNISDAIMEAK